MKALYWKWILNIGLTLLFLCIAKGAAAQSAPLACNDVINAYKDAVGQDRCLNVPVGTACYGSALVACQAKPKTFNPLQVFNWPGNKVDIRQLASLRTSSTGSNRGAAILVANTSKGQVKLYAIGNTNMVPGSNNGVYSLYRTNAGEVCNQTPSGLMLQTPKGEKGRVAINGVNIDLSSTAYVSVEGDVIFDQDPRLDRRQGSRNPNAPLCSGFDSECNFANCPVNTRLMWGPFCREDSYAYIRPGLYRVTLFGAGQVTAGATDYGATNKMFSIMSQEMTLPASYTFCWPGLQPGGTGFETEVLNRSSDARIDHLRVEFLSDDCRAISRLGSSTPDMMTVANLEGQITVSIAGRSYSPRPGEEVRIYFANGRPVRIDPPVQATILLRSELIRELETHTLPLVNSGSQPSTGSPSTGNTGGTYTCSPEYVKLDAGQCTNLRWDVEGVKAVYLDGAGVTGHETRQVCPSASHTYELRIVTNAGDRFCRMQVDTATPPKPQILYDFIAEAPNAIWSGTQGTPTWQGEDTSNVGIARWVNNALLTDGSRTPRVLEMNPNWDYGWVQGDFPTGHIMLQKGDHFVARAGFLDGATTGNATFSVWFIPAVTGLSKPQSPMLVSYNLNPVDPNLDTVQRISVTSMSTSYTNRQLLTVDVDLAEVLKLSPPWYGTFQLEVEVNDASETDRPVWVDARLERR